MDTVLAAMQRQLDQRFDANVAALRETGYEGASARVLGGRGAHRMSIDPGSVHVNQPLANVLVFYKNRKAIADDVMPPVAVQKQSDVYFQYAADTAFDTAKTDVAGQLGQVSEVSLVPSNAPYKVTNRALRDWVPVQTIDNADSPLQPLAHTEENLARYLTLAREVRVAATVFNNANYGSNHSSLAGPARWDTSTGTPVSDTFAAIQSILVNDELVAVYGEEVWNKLINNAEVKGFFTSRPSSEMGPTPMMMNADTWRNAFGLRGVHVGRMKSNSAHDPASASYGWVWGKSAAFIQVPESPGMMVAAFAYTFRWRPFTHRIHFDPIRGVEGAYMVQVHHADAEQVIDTTGATGWLYETCIS